MPRNRRRRIVAPKVAGSSADGEVLFLLGGDLLDGLGPLHFELGGELLDGLLGLLLAQIFGDLVAHGLRPATDALWHRVEEIAPIIRMV